MSPVADLRPVVDAGRQAGKIYRAIKYIPMVGVNADVFLLAELGIYLGQGGVFDYQRSGNRLSGFDQHRNLVLALGVDRDWFGDAVEFQVTEVFLLGNDDCDRRIRSLRMGPPQPPDKNHVQNFRRRRHQDC